MKPITILYGTETGNSEDCADEVAKVVRGLGLQARVFDMDDYDHDELPTEHLLMIVTSTFGNGDPPANAEALMSHLNDDQPNLNGMRFAVCALGDTSYPHFAQCGKDFDKLLGDLGGERAFDRVDCDEDFEVPFATFKRNAANYLKANPDLFPVTSDVVASDEPTAAPASGGFFSKMKSWFTGAKPEATSTAAPAQTPTVKGPFTRENPFESQVTVATLLSGEGSNKETRHYVLNLADSGIEYQAGDCFGVLPQNCPDEVASILGALGLDGETAVQWGGKTRALRSVLLRRLCLQRVTMTLVEALAQQDGAAKTALSGGDDALKAYLAGRHVIDALTEHPGTTLGAQQLVDALRTLQPRLYSIASSQVVHKDEVHFTIETTRYEWNDRQVKGVASCWLADRVGDGSVPIYLHKNDQFRLPAPDVPVIMVGPGTGIAPFRAFLQEREALKAGGDNWLFFGHQHEKTDFLYSNELKAFENSGTLTQLTCAWSRDTDNKVYVQDRLREHADTVWAWLQRGAVVYVCGDAEGMAPGVHQALSDIAEANGEADGAVFLNGLERDGRYQRDVY